MVYQSIFRRTFLCNTFLCHSNSVCCLSVCRLSVTQLHLKISYMISYQSAIVKRQTDSKSYKNSYRFRPNWSLQNNRWSYYCKVWKFFEYENYSRTWGHIYKLKKNRFNRDPRQHFFTERIINIGGLYMEQSGWTNGYSLYGKSL